MAAGGGGSWKVAFADFMTALMALFLVLWVLNQDQEVKGAVEEYFKNPWKAALSDSTGIIPVKNADVTTSQKSHFENPSAVPLETVRRVNEDLIKTFIQNPEYREHRSLQIEMTPEGLLINFLDRPSHPIFKKDSADFTDYGAYVFSTLAWEIARYTTTEIELEGHTQAGLKPLRENYGPWELSTDRANIARRSLMDHGVKERQVVKLAGFGGTRPLKFLKSNDPLIPNVPVKPDDPVNHRVSILLRAQQAIP